MQDGTHRRHREIRRQVFGVVPHEGGDPLVAGDPDAPQPVRQLRGVSTEFGVAVLAITVGGGRDDLARSVHAGAVPQNRGDRQRESSAWCCTSMDRLWFRLTTGAGPPNASLVAIIARPATRLTGDVVGSAARPASARVAAGRAPPRMRSGQLIVHDRRVGGTAATAICRTVTVPRSRRCTAACRLGSRSRTTDRRRTRCCRSRPGWRWTAPSRSVRRPGMPAHRRGSPSAE